MTKMTYEEIADELWRARLAIDHVLANEDQCQGQLWEANDALVKALALAEAHQDVVKAAARMIRHIDAEHKTTRTTGGPYQLAADNLRLSLAFILNPNGDAE